MVYEADTVFKYGDDLLSAEITRFEGIGKYPHLLVSSSGIPSKSQTRGEIEAIINFGTVAVGRTAEKWIELHNLSPVSFY